MDREARRVGDDPEKPTLGADGMPAFLSSQARGDPEADEDVVMQDSGSNGQESAAPSSQQRIGEDFPASLVAAPSLRNDPASPPLQRQHQIEQPQLRRNTSRSGLRTNFLPTPLATLLTGTESHYRGRGEFWRPGAIYEPGKWAEPSGEGWLETSNVMTEEEEAAAREKARKAEERARKAEERKLKKEEKGKGKEGEVETDASPRRLRSRGRIEDGDDVKRVEGKEEAEGGGKGMLSRLRSRGRKNGD